MIAKHLTKRKSITAAALLKRNQNNPSLPLSSKFAAKLRNFFVVIQDVPGGYNRFGIKLNAINAFTSLKDGAAEEAIKNYCRFIKFFRPTIPSTINPFCQRQRIRAAILKLSGA